MPVIGIPVDALRARLGTEIPAERLLRVLEEIGCDVEGYARLPRTRCRRCGWIEERTQTEALPARCPSCDADHRAEPETLEEIPDLEVVRMELLAVRPDMFDPGGLARALRGYLDVEVGPVAYDVGPPAARVRVDPSVRDARSSRPFLACAVLEDVRLDGDSIKILMKLQENLHWALGRNRKLASIGVYDFDTIANDLEYTTEDPDRYRFVPLGAVGAAGRPEAARTLREILEEHPKGRAYRHLLAPLARYPILRDAEGRVLSMPPVINSEGTRVHAGSRRLFADVTGTGERIVQRTLNVLVTSLLESLPGVRLRAVTIEGASDPEGKAARPGPVATPDLAPQPVTIGVAATAKLLGVPLDAAETRRQLLRMRHGARILSEERIEVEVPAYRNDILHERDLMEDVAIGYGYHNILPSLLPARTVGLPRPLETRSAAARRAMTGLGFFETLSIVLTSDEAHDAALGRAPDPRAVRIENPISGEQTRVRTSLLPGLLALFEHNRHQPLPQRVFEVGDVTWLDEGAETGAREHRMLGIGMIGPKAGFTEVRAIVEAVAREFGRSLVWEPAAAPPFLAGRCASVKTEDGTPAGILGEVDPERLAAFGLENPAVLAEISIETLGGMPPRLRFSLED
ncbi:MAG: phenylalanine--tRNA ligase subunit beta [Candidatus Eisenbacteria bacterium]